ncbi:hypothetical protein BCR37DRAFT_378614 [Protomyces lactucae-debilis]|uniref:RING-type domain-containing protein n=1 Tax=Protomyces lactucae-debilis TaxID=2754530 RepID=A0A1Y2FI81_PROLT|nr:uncharacterized protein BCR37DRAFT_378614 [Protomyces lactucae-debilis]ORY83649.1 hypothetical protein BCR37DRAFT_378614 [Protomyces lactucae-debilis]
MGNTASSSAGEPSQSRRRRSSRLSELSGRHNADLVMTGSTSAQASIAQGTPPKDTMELDAACGSTAIESFERTTASRGSAQRKTDSRVNRLRNRLSSFANPFKSGSKSRASTSHAHPSGGESVTSQAHSPPRETRDDMAIPIGDLHMRQPVPDLSHYIGADGLQRDTPLTDFNDETYDTAMTSASAIIPLADEESNEPTEHTEESQPVLVHHTPELSRIPSESSSIYSDRRTRPTEAHAIALANARNASSENSESAGLWNRYGTSNLSGHLGPATRSRSNLDAAQRQPQSDSRPLRRATSQSHLNAEQQQSGDSADNLSALLQDRAQSDTALPNTGTPRYYVRSSSSSRPPSPMPSNLPESPRSMSRLRARLNGRHGSADSTGRPSTQRSHSSPNTSQRPAASRAPHSAGEARRLNGSGQSPGEVVSALPGEDQAGMLSRLLSVAAAATAASLVGRDQTGALRRGRDLAAQHTPATPSTLQETTTADQPAVTDTESSSQGDLVDGSFDGFLAALQSGQLAQALRNGGNILGGGEPEEGSQQPLNFFRMFRFNSAVSIHGAPAATEGEGRMVPIIIVGIRSVPPREDGSPGDPQVPPFLETLGQMQPPAYRPPTTRSHTQESQAGLVSGTASQGVTTSEEITERAEGEEDVTMTEDVVASEVEQEQGQAADEPEVTSEAPIRSRQEATTTNTTPQQEERTGLLDSVLDRLRSFGGDNAAASQPDPASEIASRASRVSANLQRRRRRSQWRPFSSGEPTPSEVRPEQSTAAENNGAAQTRSWIIYVLGGTYPENHPLLTTPSLFTDSPTYEDMMLLGNLIGPAKPETAAEEDIERAGPTHDLDEMSAELENRCLICLSDFEAGETCRSLSKCSHVFHRECIDTWLTTGRNSCPLCRSATEAKNAPMAGMPVPSEAAAPVAPGPVTEGVPAVAAAVNVEAA